MRSSVFDVFKRNLTVCIFRTAFSSLIVFFLLVFYIPLDCFGTYTAGSRNKIASGPKAWHLT